MTLTDRDLLGALAVMLGLIGYAFYFRDIFSGKTKPHAFSWLVWMALTGIGFAAQVVEGGGAGAWVTGLATIVCFAVFVLVLTKGERTFPLFDWMALCIAAVSLWLWYKTNDPTLSVILITVTDAIGYIPTFRKAFHKPFEETTIAYALYSIKFIPALLALDAWNISTVLYPASLIVMNGAFTMLLIIRRKQLK